MGPCACRMGEDTRSLALLSKESATCVPYTPHTRATHQPHTHKIKCCPETGGVRPHTLLNTVHAIIISRTRGGLWSVSVSARGFCLLPRATHSLHVPRAAQTSTALHGTPAPFFAAWGHCAWGQDACGRAALQAQRCVRAQTCARSSAGRLDQRRCHDVQTGVERARRADGGGEGGRRVGGGGGLRGLIRRADVLRPSRCGCLLSSAGLPSLPVGGVAGACGRAAPVAGSACACCARRR